MIHWSASTVCCSCLLIGQWHPEAEARALNCGWISYCFAVSIFYTPVPDDATRCRFRNALVQGGARDDLLGSSDRGLPSDRGSRAAAAIIDADDVLTRIDALMDWR
ncbi:MAG: hypothetical protein GDA36_01810, partial [Rhodobacteraceae bacterium]|nr:hypothetical protein [Paracoccaceae bacterium]